MSKMKPYQWLITVVCVFFMFFNQMLPPVFGLNAAGMGVMCIFIATLVMLLTVSNTWPVLLMIAAFPTAGLYSIGQSLQMTWGHSVVCFMIFNMAMLEVMRQTGVLRRIAVSMITMPFAKKSSMAFLCCLWGAGLIMGSFIDITANIILFTTLTAEILTSIGITKDDRFAKLVMLGNLVCCGFAYGVTPIGKPTAIAVIGLFKDYAEVSILQYSLVGFAVAAVVFVLFVFVIKVFYRLDASRLAQFDTDELRKSIEGPMSKDEKYSLIIFVAVVVLWLLPDVSKLFSVELSAFLTKYGTVTAPMLACVAMCLIHVDGRPMMDFPKALKDGLSWPALTVIMAAMMLSSAATNADAGIVALLSDKLSPIMSGASPLVFVFVLGMICTVITNFCSCTVAAMIPATVAIALYASGAITGVNMQALCIVIGLTEGIAYQTAAAGTVAAVTAGYGWLPTKMMLKDGGILAIIFGVVSTLLGYGLGCLMF